MTVIPGEGPTDVLHADMMDLLVCPLDYADLRLEGQELVCVQCGRHYPVKDGVADMLLVEDDR